MLIISAGLFGYIISSIKNILEIKWKKAKEYKLFFLIISKNTSIINREAIRVINAFMRDKNVSFELQSRVRKYLEFVMKKEINHEQEQDILNNLNISLKSEVILQTQGKLLIQNPFFIKNFSESTNQSLANKLKKITLSPEELN